ncbi:MAG: phosphoribosylformylglycinamidine synthase [Firmicutes bacterium HGW-Firmicutes-16]|nr:MAG: phosphoribosylformylglycinamidine synthase [Firmicutes bacterium HGW-Firmicutes-16]
MVYRVYVEKKSSEALEAQALCDDIRSFLGVMGLEYLRIINRYDVENISEELFKNCKQTVFSEPQLDIVSDKLEYTQDSAVFAVEYLPGQFDQRADSAAQCVQIVSQGERPIVRTARVYVLNGTLAKAEIDTIKNYVINPVESRLASLETYETLKTEYEIPTEVEILDGFRAMDCEEVENFIRDKGLAMDEEDLRFCQKYFASEKRDPTITEIKMIDTYWSDHCRHTTFNTVIDSVRFEDKTLQNAWDRYIATRNELNRTKPVSLMDIGTLAAKQLKAQGKLDKLDESEEINACTVKIDVETENGTEKWLLLFKNETHNHPTEIEPFGGAATCIGGAIRDPLSGRSYVYAAMRVSGAADPTKPVSGTLKGKLPQKKLVSTAAAGYSSYGNQIGLATGIVDEIYHPGYAAKHMEVGAVIGAAPEENVRRERPNPGDIVILLGGRTGRDGCGGATGSSKAHNLSSLGNCGAEVQKGNAPEERKLQRLFRNPEASRLIKRCNDFGAGGVSVAIGELAEGLIINLNAIPKKYEGLDGTELAISESQERMAVVVDKYYVNRFMQLAAAENLEATVVAEVSEFPRLIMYWNGKAIVNVTRRFLDSNGAEKHIDISPAAPKSFGKELPADFESGLSSLVTDLNVCSKRGLSERFDSTIGAGSVLMPFGGRYQQTPIQAMVHKISREHGDTSTCSFMSYGYNPNISEKSPYHGAYLAVVESVSKLVASGASFEDIYLSFQEYFEKPLRDGKRWGKPLSALLGAFEAQLDLGVAAIGGKDSMSGSFEKLDVPPTLISFAVTTDDVKNVASPEFKAAGHKVCLLSPIYDSAGIPEAASLKENFRELTELLRSGKACAVWTPTFGGVAEGIFKMCIGNGLGFAFEGSVSLDDIFGYRYGSFILEMTGDDTVGIELGFTTEKAEISWNGKAVSLFELQRPYEDKLESVYPCNIKTEDKFTVPYSFERKGSNPKPRISFARPKAIIPVFPGTNCEYDTAKALEKVGAEAEIIVIKNLTQSDISGSVERFARELKSAQMIVIPGGFSGGDEPDGSAKFITSFFRNAAIRDEVEELLGKRDGLMLGICNGFQALIKLGLVPYGHIVDTDEDSSTLSYNTIGRHQSKLVRTRISSNLSPWLLNTKVGEVYTVPVSHGEGRFLASDELIRKLGENGQITTQYVDLEGKVTQDIRYNPNGSACAIEGITSPDGRVFGKMGHSERIAQGLYKNVDGNLDIGLFASAIQYYK